VVFYKQKCSFLVQVCYEVHIENQKRELDGLIEAIHFFDKKIGFIVTMNQKDTLKIDNKVIELIPAYQFFEK
jgi:hypothetical protein